MLKPGLLSNKIIIAAKTRNKNSFNLQALRLQKTIQLYISKKNLHRKHSDKKVFFSLNDNFNSLKTEMINKKTG